MNRNRLYYLFVLFFVLPFFWLQQSGCAKEYSFEGGDTAMVKDTVFIHDSMPPLVVKDSSACSLCKETDSTVLGSWNFKNGHSYFCGLTNDAGFVGTNTTFTFFGSSACSVDTGLVMTVYLPIAFDKDMYNISTGNVAFYYYDHHSTKDIFISESSAPFSVTVASYIHATGIVTGSFEGTVYKRNGDTTYIRDGKFKVKLK